MHVPLPARLFPRHLSIVDMEAALEQWKKGDGAEVWSALVEAKTKFAENKSLIKVG